MNDLKMACVDIETTGKVWSSRILSVGVSYRNGDGGIHSKAWNIGAYDLFHSAFSIPQVRQELTPILAQADAIVAHNASFDLSYLFKHGIVIGDQVKGKLVDTLTLARMTGPHQSVALDNLCAEENIGTAAWRASKGNRKILDKVPVQNLLSYNQEDTSYNLLLAEKLVGLGIQQYDLSTILRESEFCRVMAEIRNRGMGLNAEKVYKRIQDITLKKAGIFNTHIWGNRIEGPNDRTGILRFLDKFGVHTGAFTAKGAESLDEKAIKGLIWRLCSRFPVGTDENGEEVDEEIYYDSGEFRPVYKLDQTTKTIVDVLDAVLACRGWEKEINTWLRPMVEEHGVEDGRIHPLYTVSGAVTYRLTCSEPGFQAMPKLDIWEPHHSFDWSQAEYRLAALYAMDNEMAQRYLEGYDAHEITAQRIFKVEKPTKKQRGKGKGTNFASGYGAGPPKMAAQLGIPVEEAAELLRLYRVTLPKMYNKSKEVKDKWKERGHIRLWTGKRKYPRDNQERYDRSFVAWNALMQGGVAEIAKEAMLECDKRNIPMIGQIHDDIRFPVGIDIEEVKEIMENALPESIRNWTTPAIQMRVDHEPKF